MNEQKRLAPDKTKDAISKGKVYTTKKGVLGIATGYMESAFKENADGENLGVIGLTYEFGRPGQSSERSDDKMEQTRKRRKNPKNKKEKAVPKKIKVSKGKIAAVPHIRKGFDNKVNEAVQEVIKSVNAEIDKLQKE